MYRETESRRPVGQGPGAFCLASGLTVETAVDGAGPLPGAAFRYLVRAVNACGGPWGSASDGTPRAATACP